MKRPLRGFGKKILHGISMSALFAVSLVIALFTTSFAPTMFRETMAEAYIPPAPVAVTTEPETQAPETTAAPTTETTTEEETTKKVVYKAKTNVKTQVATGDKKKDEDKGNDKVKDESLTSSGSGEDLPEYKPTPLPSTGGVGVQSKYTDFVYADTSNLTGWQTIDGAQFYFNNSHKPLTGMQKIGNRNYYFNSYGAKASLVGIDVSQWNGTINWSKVKADGIDFAIIRVGFRGYGTSTPIKPVTLDKNVRTNIVNAKKAGIAVGLYFFSQAISIDEALEEAGACVNIARQYGIQYPIYFDTEYSNPDRDGRADSLSKSKRTDIAVAFCEAVKNAGYAPGVYASKSFYDDELQFSRLSSYNIWVAHYTSKNTDFRYSYKIWQYSSTGSVSGISNNTDMNISLYDYAKKSDMKNLGSKVVLTNAAGVQSYTLAETKLTAYEETPTDAIYKDTFSTISALPDARVKSALLEKLEELHETAKATTTAAASTTAEA